MTSSPRSYEPIPLGKPELRQGCALFDGSTYFIAFLIFASDSALQYLQSSCRNTEVYGMVIRVFSTNTCMLLPVSVSRSINSWCRTESEGLPAIRRFSSSRYRPTPGASDSGTYSISLSRSEEHTSELQSLRHLVCR